METVSASERAEVKERRPAAERRRRGSRRNGREERGEASMLRNEKPAWGTRGW